jgi:hypothetical protein
MKAPNLCSNQELMVMTTNLYYHCWFRGAGLQETHPLHLFLMLLSLFVSLLHFLLLMFSFSTAPHPHKNKRKKEKTKPQKSQIKTPKKIKNKDITKTSNKATQNRK